VQPKLLKMIGMIAGSKNIRRTLRLPYHFKLNIYAVLILVKISLTADL
jgi:hypothetical protein